MAERRTRSGSRKKAAARSTTRDARVVVVDGQGRRPFMRGIIVHALMARGISFEDAYRTADAVRDRLRGREEIARDELNELVARELAEYGAGEMQPVIHPAEIEVTSGRRSEPFSKGVLSQSLLAAAIDPNDAFETARDIEDALVERAKPRITRTALRKLAVQALLERFGEKTAQRFMIWRQHQEPLKPVIVLLGGTTGAGKTSIALEVALRLGIRRVLSTDSIRQVMRIVLSEQLAPALHASSFDAHKVLNLEVGGGDSPVVDGFLQQATSVAVGVRAMMDRAVEEHTSLVLDGVSLVPGLIDFDAYAESAYVIPLVVARLDHDAFRGHFRARGNEGSRRGMKRYLDNFDGILEIQDRMLELADEHGVPIVDNDSVERSVMLVIRHVVEALRVASSEEPELPYA